MEGELETVISGPFVYEEPYNTDNKQESIYNYGSIKHENIGDLTVVVRETDLITDCGGDTACVNEAVISGRYIKQEPCDVKDWQGSIHNYFGVEDENTDCINNKVCAVYIKEEPYDTEDKQGGIHNYNDMKEENIDDFMFVGVNETELTPTVKVNYLTCCEECGEEYDLYCLKCPMLNRIFDSHNIDERDSIAREGTLPRNFIDICETQSGMGIVALRMIPKGVVFGPFRGLDSSMNDLVSKWKLKNKELVYAKDSSELNWMQYIKRAVQGSYPNLTPFQYKNELYYRSDCYISVGDKLLVCWDSDTTESGIEDMEDSYWEPRVCESLPDSYACMLCCVGYKSISHLKAHNSICPGKRNQNDFCKEIVQCDTCKIYLDRKEYSDFHMEQCYNSNRECGFEMDYRSNCGDPLNHHVATKPIKLETCDMGFRNTPLFVRHNKEVDGISNKTYSCDKCEYRTHRKLFLSEHLMKVHNHPNLFSCSLCSYKTVTNANLLQHVAIHNEDKPFACTLCPFKTKKRWNLKLHIATHNDDRPYACSLCSYKAKKASTLKQHFASHNDNRPFTCTLCPYKATTNPNLKQHMASHNTDKPFACSLCPYKATRNAVLKLHVATHNDYRPFACPICPYKAKKTSNLKQHIATHNDDRSFACALCPYKATTKSGLKQHMETHTADKPLTCALCPYKATRNSTLKRHMLTHNGNRPFACTICPYKSKTNLTLKQHIATHNSDKLFACTLCPHKAKTKLTLKRHILAHSNGRLFACSICPFKAKTSAILERHVAVHNDDSSFACPLCPYKATKNWILTAHIADHNGCKPFACTLCPYKAKKNWILKRHMVTHNGDKGAREACTLSETKLS